LRAERLYYDTIYENAIESFNSGEGVFIQDDIDKYAQELATRKDNYDLLLPEIQAKECSIFGTNCVGEPDIEDITNATIYEKFLAIADLLDKDNFLIPSNYKVFRKFHTLSDTSYDNDTDLLNAMIEYSREYRFPQIDISINVIDILAAQDVPVSEKIKIKLGEKINIYFPEFNIDQEAQIKEIAINFQDFSMSLVISTVKNYNRPFAERVIKSLNKVIINNNNTLIAAKDDTKETIKGTFAFERQARSPNGIGLSIAAGVADESGSSTMSLSKRGIVSTGLQFDPITETFEIKESTKSNFSPGVIVMTYDVNNGVSTSNIRTEMSARSGINISRKNSGDTTYTRKFWVDTSGNVNIDGIVTAAAGEIGG
jgi:hypothetical protein